MESTEFSGENNYSKKDKQILIKMMKVLRYWEDADFFSLNVKKMVSEHMYDEIKDDFNPPDRGL